MNHYGSRYHWECALAAIKSFKAFLHGQKRKRWHRHLQRSCGTKPLWEILVFTGRFDVETLQAALAQRSSEQDGDAEEDTQGADQEQRRLLRHAKAEAQACYNEGRRLARQRDAHRDRSCGASQPAGEAGSCDMTQALTSWQTDLLERYDSGVLLKELNNAIGFWGHGRLRSEDGDTLDIGGSTGGGSRRLIDGWVMPDWREYLWQSDTIREFLRSASPERS